MGLIFKYTAYFNAAVSMLLGLFVYLNAPIKKTNIFFFMLSLSISLYAVFFALSIYAPKAEISLLEVRVFHVFCCFIATFLFLFVNELIFRNTFSRIWHYLPFITSAITSYYILFGNVIAGVEPVGSLPNWTIPGNQFFLYLFHYGFFTTLPVILLFMNLSKTTAEMQKQIKLVLIGVGLALLGGWTTFLPGWGIKVEPYGIHFIFVFQFIVAYTILKYQLMNIKATLSRVGALITTFIIYGIGYLFLAYFYAVVFGRNPRSYPFIAISLICGLIAGLYFNKLRLLLQTAAEKAFIKGWYDYRRVSRKAAAGLAKTLTHEDIVNTLYPIFQEDIDISESHFYFFDKKAAGYVELDTTTGEPKKGNILFSDDPAVRQLLERKDVAIIDNKLYLPSFSGDNPVAIFILGKKRSEDEYTNDDVELFRTISEYAAIALEYIVKPYEEVKEKFEASERKLIEAERQVERSSRLASLGTLAAGVAHEIRNPMTVLRSKAQKLSDRLDDRRFLKEYADLSMKHIDRILDIVKGMLDIARTKEFERNPVNINALIEETFRFFSISRIEVIKRLNPVPEIEGDPSQLTQVFINLIQNAVRAMAGGGTLTISTGIENGQVKVEITDTGSGIPAENLVKIFDPFFTTWPEGAGLGLSTVHRIVADHGGRIEVKSKEGEGTTFTIYFPAG